MSTYAIGDIQGCFKTLQKLIEKIPFDDGRDRIWLAGDLVNRGPRSLEVLRWAKSRGSRLRLVLGNHDLHLIARSLGLAKPKKSETIQDVLDAPDRDELIEWLRGQPLLVREGQVAMVHGGLDPSWSLNEAEALAGEISETLRGPVGPQLLKGLSGELPSKWDPRLKGLERLQLALKIFTSIRICRPDGTFAFPFSGTPQMAPLGYFPWFQIPGRKSAGATVVFGHWAALGLKIESGIIALDSGCVWGRELSAVRLEDQALFQVDNAES